MLGEIFGRKAGEIVAELVPCRFLPDLMLAFDSGRLGTSCNRTDGVVAKVLGVLEALIFAELAEILGVFCSSVGLLVVSKGDSIGRVADSGSMISSITSSPSSRAFIGTPFSKAFLLGIRIRVAGVAGPLANVICPCAKTFGDLETARGTAGGGIKLSDKGSGETELSLLIGALPDADEGFSPLPSFGSLAMDSSTPTGSLVKDACLRRVCGFMAGDCLTLLLPPGARVEALGLRRWRFTAEVGGTRLLEPSFMSIGEAVVPVDPGPR